MFWWSQNVSTEKVLYCVIVAVLFCIGNLLIELLPTLPLWDGSVYLQIRLSFRKHRKLIFPEGFYHLHSIIDNFPSTFCHPHFIMSIFPSAIHFAPHLTATAYSCFMDNRRDQSLLLSMKQLLSTAVLRKVVLQAPAVQRLDNAIHRINHYQLDSVVCFVNTYPLDSDFSGG